MLEKPDISEARIIEKVEEDFDIQVTELTFLPLGADVNTAVFRVNAGNGATDGGAAYFLKLRRGVFKEITATVPAYLHGQGIHSIIAPLKTNHSQPWSRLDGYAMLLYPYISGQDGYETSLSPNQWLAFGAALNAIHSAQLPPEIAQRIPREQFSPVWRQSVKSFQNQVAHTTFNDPAAAAMATTMREKRVEIDRLVARADWLADRLRDRTPDFVLCHTDMHPGNLLIQTQPAGARQGLFIVDWDNPTYAPKELDLIMVGGSPLWNEPAQNVLFYQGYFGTGTNPLSHLDRMALAYYRYERIIQDIAAFGEQLLASDQGGADRDQSVIYFNRQFLPGHEVDLAFATERQMKG